MLSFRSTTETEKWEKNSYEKMKYKNERVHRKNENKMALCRSTMENET